MNNTKLLAFWLISIALIVVSYFWIDQALATFIHDHQWRAHLSNIPGFKKLVEWPSFLSSWAPILFFVFLLFPQKNTTRNMILCLCLSVFLAYILKNDLKWVFSRYWPETWVDDNLSWIRDQAYGCQWFQGKLFYGKDVTGSFPSGHSTVAFASLISIGLFFRKYLMIFIILASLEAFFMFAFNYHFLSDIIAGACLGTTCAVLCRRVFIT